MKIKGGLEIKKVNSAILDILKGGRLDILKDGRWVGTIYGDGSIHLDKEKWVTGEANETCNVYELLREGG